MNNSQVLELFEKLRKTQIITLLIDVKSYAVIDLNERARVFYGCTSEAAGPLSYQALCTKDEIAVEKEIQDCLLSGSIFIQTMHKTLDGSFKDVEINGTLWILEDKPVLLYLIEDKTEVRVITEKLRNSELKFHRVLQDIPSISVQGYLRDGTTFYWNKASEDIYGYSEKEALGKPLVDLIIPDPIKDYVRNDIEQAFRTGIPPAAGELQLLHKDGHLIDVFSSHVILELNDKESEMFCIDIDISERKIARKLRLAASVFTHAIEPILITDSEGQITDVNHKFLEVFGFSSEEVMGRKPSLLKSGIHEEAVYEGMWQALSVNGSWVGEIINRKKNGDLVPMFLRINTVKDADGNIQNYVCFYTDLTYLKKHQAELEHAAYYDALTGLPNRALLYKTIVKEIAACRAKQEKMALVYLDLDGFKQINDTYGHDVGDIFLQYVSGNMKRQLREEDMLARLGGDEFVAVLTGLKDESDSVPVVERLLAATKMKILVEDHALSASASIGVAIFPDDGEEPDTLMRLADKAMYLSKNNGKNRYLYHAV